MAERPLTKFTYEGVVVRKRSRVPHWHVPHGLYFVTYRLHDSLPAEVETRIAVMKADIARRRLAQFDAEAARDLEREMFKIVEGSLDRHLGACFMRQPDIADLVVSVFDRDDLNHYRLLALAAMPNHLHVVFRLENGELDAVVRNWKSYSAYLANRRLGRRGAFWQSDYFDILIRDSRQLERSIAYVLANPLKADLRQWRWVRSWPDRITVLY